MVSRDSKVHNFANSLVLLISIILIFRLRLGDPFFVCQNPSRFVCLILQDRFRVLHVPFIHMVKFQFLELFPVDPIAHRFVSNLILYYLGIYCLKRSILVWVVSHDEIIKLVKYFLLYPFEKLSANQLRNVPVCLKNNFDKTSLCFYFLGLEIFILSEELIFAGICSGNDTRLYLVVRLRF